MLCNAAINIANIEGGKLACAKFKMLHFLRSGHIIMLCQLGCDIVKIQCMCVGVHDYVCSVIEG